MNKERVSRISNTALSQFPGVLHPKTHTKYVNVLLSFIGFFNKISNIFLSVESGIEYLLDSLCAINDKIKHWF